MSESLAKVVAAINIAFPALCCVDLRLWVDVPDADEYDAEIRSLVLEEFDRQFERLEASFNTALTNRLTRYFDDPDLLSVLRGVPGLHVSVVALNEPYPNLVVAEEGVPLLISGRTSKDRGILAINHSVGRGIDFGAPGFLRVSPRFGIILVNVSNTHHSALDPGYLLILYLLARLRMASVPGFDQPAVASLIFTLESALQYHQQTLKSKHIYY